MEKKFLADFMLGSLARRLRFLGIDTLCINEKNRENIIALSIREDRILLTRSHWFPKRNNIYVIETDDPDKQTKEVVMVFNLSPKPFTRCSVCNSLLERIDRDCVKDMVADYVFQTQKEFSRCTGCGKIYWRGTHYQGILKMIDKIREL